MKVWRLINHALCALLDNIVQHRVRINLQEIVMQDTIVSLDLLCLIRTVN